MGVILVFSQFTDKDKFSLAGKILIANPCYYFSDLFNKSLIYITSHNSNGALGVIINYKINKMPLRVLFRMLKNYTNSNNLDEMIPVYVGGPVEPEKGFVLHTDEYDKNLIIRFSGGLAISSNVDILEDIAIGRGPEKSIFIVGYTRWEEGQMEKEIEDNFWLISDCDEDLIFSDKWDNGCKWKIALNRLGVQESFFSSQQGHA